MKNSRGEFQEAFEQAAAAAWVDVGLRTLSDTAWDRFCRAGGHALYMLHKERTRKARKPISCDEED